MSISKVLNRIIVAIAVIGIASIAVYSPVQKAEAQVYYTHTYSPAMCVRCVGPGCGNANVSMPTYGGTWKNTDTVNYLTLICPLPNEYLSSIKPTQGVFMLMYNNGNTTWAPNYSAAAQVCTNSFTSGNVSCGTVFELVAQPAGGVGNVYPDTSKYNTTSGYNNFLEVFLGPVSGGISTEITAYGITTTSP